MDYPQRPSAGVVQYQQIYHHSEDHVPQYQSQDHIPLATHDTTKEPTATARASSESRQRQPRFRYLFRGAVGVLGPVIITAFFIATWRVYLVDLETLGDVDFIIGPPGGNYVFYAWFLVGDIGLSVAQYGLLGVEASLLLGAGATTPLEYLREHDHESV